ncbi:MAG: hypothetical protein ACQETK_13310 [Pseudomonadota bacterium]
MMERKKAGAGVRKTLLALGVSAFVLALTSGCGGSSSSSDDGGSADSGGDSGTGTAAVSDEVVVQNLRSLALGASELGDGVFAGWDLDMPVGALSLSDDTVEAGSVSGMTIGKAVELLRENQSVQPMQTVTEPCDSGSLTMTTRSDGADISFNGCVMNMDQMQWAANGRMSVREAGPALGYTDSFQLSFSGLSFEISGGGDSMEMGIDGAMGVYVTQGSLLGGRAELDIQQDMAVSCGSGQFSLSNVFDDFVYVATEESPGLAVTVDGAGEFSGSGIRDVEWLGPFSIATIDPVRYPSLHDYPGSGEQDVVVGGQPFHIEYDQGGVFVNGTFYSWSDIESEAEMVDVNETLQQCQFLNP